MEHISFEEVIAKSPVLPEAIKTVLLENVENINGAGKQAIMQTLLEYERALLEGMQEFQKSPENKLP